jgi:orotidine-5'-phosphate decarboxylase
MANLHFADRLTNAIQQKRTPLVVGIDPRVQQLPSVLAIDQTNRSPQQVADAVLRFSIGVIDAVADLVPAVKPQAAFFEQLGPLGCQVLANVVDHATDQGLIVVMDAKRGDIGSTAEAYAAAYLGPKPESAWGCDCLTVNAYMGNDTLQPFVKAANRTGSGLFVLVKTSNPGSDWLQAQRSNETATYHLVADEVQRLSANSAGESGYGNIGAVIGATYPEQLQELRARMPNTLFLIPGFGAQGGTASDVAGGLDDNGLGGLINSSRGIIFAYQKAQYATFDWQDAVRKAAEDTIDRIADGTTASKLR